MASLAQHLAQSESHGRLPFRPDCPICRAERLRGQIAAGSPGIGRVGAGLAIAALGAGSLAPGSLAMAQDDASGGLTETGATESFGYEAPAEEEEQLEDAPSTNPNPYDAPERNVGPIDREEDPTSVTEPPPPTPPPPASLNQPVPIGTPPEPPTPPSPTVAQPPPAQPPQLTPRPAPARLDSPPQQHRQQRRERPQTTGQAAVRAAHTRDAHAHATVPARAAEPSPPTPSAGSAQSEDPVTTAVAAQPSTPDLGPGARVHVVRSGESLWLIARALLGGAASPGEIAGEVDRLWRLNRDRIGTGDPSLILAGTKLRLR